MPSKTPQAYYPRKADSWNGIQLELDAPKVRIISGMHAGRVGCILREYSQIYLVWLSKDTRVFVEKDDVIFE